MCLNVPDPLAEFLKTFLETLFVGFIYLLACSYCNISAEVVRALESYLDKKLNPTQ